VSFSDWINVATFGIGLVLIFVAGFWSGRLWERAGGVYRVLRIPYEPPPWDPDGFVGECPDCHGFHVPGGTGWREELIEPGDPGEIGVTCERSPIPVRRGIYDFDEQRHV
jgi:hypothetical protein